MAVSSKIFEALAGAIKLNDTISRLADDIKYLSKEVREIDRRLIRIEAFVEISEKQRKLSHSD